MHIFDTNVFVAALRSRCGASFVILNVIRRGLVAGAVSQALFLEYADVLKREANQAEFWLEAESVDTILAVLADRLAPTSIYYRWRPQLTDPDDEMVLECAVNAQAETIVTFNKKDFLPAALQFGIAVLSPSEFVKKFNLVEKLSR